MISDQFEFSGKSFLNAIRASVAVGFMLVAGSASAAVVYDESISGDLNSISSPTSIVLGLGSNIINGENGGGDYSDSFMLDLTGLELVSINVLGIEIDSGSTVRFSNCLAASSSCAFSANENAGTSFTVSDLGGDLLAELLGASPTSPITSLFELTESEGPSRYSLDFVTVASVPLPAGGLLLLGGLGAMGALRARRKKPAAA